jgi:hypothetical protein
MSIIPFREKAGQCRVGSLVFFRQDFSSGLAVGPVSGVLLGGGARKGSDGFPPVRFSKTNLRKASRSINLISAVLLKGRFLVCGSLPGASTRLPTRNEQAATVFYPLRSSVQHRQVVASGLNLTWRRLRGFIINPDFSGRGFRAF